MKTLTGIPARNAQPHEVRFDLGLVHEGLDTESMFGGVNAQGQAFAGLITLEARWAYRNNVLRCARLEAEALCAGEERPFFLVKK